ncbi:MAG: glycosyltransferase family A protein, partial [Patescibacteria group bacterium]
MKYPFISIIIVAEEYNLYLEESLPKYKDLDYPNFEVLVFTTKPCNKKSPKVKFISAPSLAGNPAKRRDLAIKYAKGSWLAFIDDDAYPSKDWLKVASFYFGDMSITAVCGPGVT